MLFRRNRIFMQENGTVSEKKYFLVKLLAPRPGFPATMTDEDRRVMQEHGAYLKGYVDKGTVIVMGPVLDPAGAWGVAILEVNTVDEVSAILAQDPTILSGLGFRYEVYPMLAAMVRK
jgi:uncharacterized protein YciI